MQSIEYNELAKDAGETEPAEAFDKAEAFNKIDSESESESESDDGDHMDTEQTGLEQDIGKLPELDAIFKNQARRNHRRYSSGKLPELDAHVV